MLWTIFTILAVLWLLGMVSSYTMGGAIHVLLVLAVIVLLLNVLGGGGCSTRPGKGALRSAPSTSSTPAAVP